MSLDNGNDIFYVDKILKRRILSNERIEYYVKWMDFPNEYNTWEPVSNLLNVSSIIKEFERKRALKSITDLPIEKILAKRLTTDGQVEYFVKWLNWSDEFNSWESESYFRKTCKVLKKYNENCAQDTAKTSRRTTKTVINGFKKGLEADKILGATNVNGNLQFLVEFKHSAGVELVANKIIRSKRPDLVIAFYEERIRWAD